MKADFEWTRRNLIGIENLSPDEIRDIYLYQGRWIQEQQAVQITIDNVPPTTTLLAYTPNVYLPDAPLELAVSAIDDLSGVASVEVQADGDWLPASTCGGDSVWCLWWPPVGQGNPGEGVHTFYTRATDKVGNVEAAQDPHTLLVDTTPPVLTVAGDGALFAATLDTYDIWRLSLSGTVNDPELTGSDTPGSGVAAVAVTLFDTQGDTAGQGLQHAQVNNQTHSWQLAYGFVEQPSGAYTVTVQVEDEVGNTASRSIHLLVDAAPPTVTLNTVDFPTKTPLTTLALTGTVVEYPLSSTVAGVAGVDMAFTPMSFDSTFYNETPTPQFYLMAHNLMAHWPLDDVPPDDETVYVEDISDHSLNGWCTSIADSNGTECPTFLETGHTGSAARFDGVDDAVALPSAATLGLYDHDFTVSAWVKLDSTSGGDKTILGTAEKTSNHGLHLTVRQGKPYMGFYGNDTAGKTTLETGRWYHLVWRYQKTNWPATAYAQAIYVNGQLDAYKTYSDPFMGTGTVYLGRAWPGTYFDGLIDDVQIYHRALVYYEIQELFFGSGPVVALSMDEARLVGGSWPEGGSRIEDRSGWEQHGRLLSRDRDNKAVPGVVGAYALALGGNGEYVYIPNDNALNPSRFTIAFWAKINHTEQNYAIAYKGNVPNSGYGGAWSFGAIAVHNGGPGIKFSVQNNQDAVYKQIGEYTWADNEWHHIVGIYNGAQAILYVDGVQRGSAPVNYTAYNRSSINLGSYIEDSVFDGQLDDFRLYPRVLSEEEIKGLYGNRWQSVNVSPTGEGVPEGTWSASVPAGLEGLYTLDLRASDMQDQISVHDNQWSGLVDTLAPRISWTASARTTMRCWWSSWSGYRCYAYSTGRYDYTYTIQDFNLTLDGFRIFCYNGYFSNFQREYYQSPWYRSLSGDTNRLYQVSGRCNNTTLPPSQYFIRVCDTAGNCTTNSRQAARHLSTPAQDPPSLFTAVLSPTYGSLITHSQPISLGMGVIALDTLRAVTFTMDMASDLSVPLYTQTFSSTDALTSTAWFTTWTPIEGQHVLHTTATDWLTGTARDTITFTVDTQAPQLMLATTPLTRAHYNDAGLLTLSGLVTDTGGIQQIQAHRVPDGAESTPATIIDNRWFTAVPLTDTRLLDGVPHTFTVQATDIASRTVTITESITVDVVAPQPVTLTLLANGNVVTPGMTLRAISPTLTLTWTTSSDGSGLDSYRVEWHSRPSYTATATTTSITRAPGDQFISIFTAGEAQQINVSLIIRDSYGNARVQSIGPIYVDAPLTPDYVTLAPASGTIQPHQVWLDSGCSLVGVDRRSDREMPESAARDGEQRFYVSWDAPSPVAGEGRGGGVRLAWTGANWDGDGDLFVYFDTQPGGATQAYDPYTATQNTTALYLPGTSPYYLATRQARASQRQAAPRAATSQNTHLAATQAAPLEADYVVWVEDSATSWLLHWDSAAWAWVSPTLLTDAQYHFVDDQTDLYVPFDMLGVTDPASTTLNLVAFASEEDALELWATFPNANPLNSAFVINTTPYEDAFPTFALSRYYTWSNLGTGICPNGSTVTQQRMGAAPAQSYPDTEVQVEMTVEPIGTVYSFIGDALYFLWEDLFGFKTADISTLFDFIDHQHPPLGDGQMVTYTLAYRNLGTETATNVWVDVSAWYALRLPNGEHLPDEERDHQVVVIGDILPGETGIATFRGVVNLAQARAEYYEPCVNEWPDLPALCSPYLEWATVDAFVYDDAHPESGPPLDWQWVDHQVDSAAPVFFDITQPDYLIGPSDNTFTGYGYDASGEVNLTLALTTPTGNDSTLTCPGADAAGQWQCTWNATQANEGTPPDDGDTFTARVQATDAFAQGSGRSAPHAFVVDAVPPTLTLALPETPPLVSGSTYRLTGDLADNRGLGAVEVCWADNSDCGAATLALDGGLPALTLSDTPTTPLPIDGTTLCDSSALTRTFEVTESFTVGSVQLAFQAEHTYRDDVQVDLEAPDGTRACLIFPPGGLASTQQNYNVLLDDAASAGLHAFRYDDDLDSPTRRARPYEPLRAFAGVAAAGTWTVHICDTAPWFDDGAYHSSQLMLTPRGAGVAPRAGTWVYDVPLPPEQDGVTHTLHVYASDLAGNRSLTTLDLVVDNVGPVLTVTEALEASLWGAVPQQVLAGTTTDGGGEVISVTASVQTPNGDFYTVATDRNAAAWQYDLLPTSGGDYTLWVSARDAAGNQTVAGPYAVTAALPPTLYKLVTPQYASLGEVVTYTLIVRNRNPEPARGVVVADPLPEGLTLRGTVDGTAYMPLPGHTLVWPAFDLDGGATAYLEFAATVTEDSAYYGAIISNTAYLTTTSLGGSVSDVVPLILESAPPPALITKTVAMAHTPVHLGDMVTYTIVAGDSRMEVDSVVVISDTLPEGVSGTNLSWTGVLSAGRQITFTLPVTVTTDVAYYGQTITNVVHLYKGSDVYTSIARFTVEAPGTVYLPLVVRLQ